MFYITLSTCIAFVFFYRRYKKFNRVGENITSQNLRIAPLDNTYQQVENPANHQETMNILQSDTDQQIANTTELPALSYEENVITAQHHETYTVISSTSFFNIDGYEIIMNINPSTYVGTVNIGDISFSSNNKSTVMINLFCDSEMKKWSFQLRVYSSIIIMQASVSYSETIYTSIIEFKIDKNYICLIKKTNDKYVLVSDYIKSPITLSIVNCNLTHIVMYSMITEYATFSVVLDRHMKNIIIANVVMR